MQIHFWNITCSKLLIDGTIVDLVGNDNIMMLSLHDKMGLLWNFSKKCDVQWNFWFCCIWFMWCRCVVCPQHVTAELAFYSFIFMIVLNSLISWSKFLTWPSLFTHGLMMTSHKKLLPPQWSQWSQHPSWQLLLAWPVIFAVVASLWKPPTPSNNAGFFVAGGGGQQFSRLHLP